MTPLEAVSLAAHLHDGQRDKLGQPYIGHCVRVMMRLPADASDEERIAALLHDVIEDVPDGHTLLMKAGVPEMALAIVVQLTRAGGESYDTYIKRVGIGWGSRIKIADLEDNSDPSRLGRLPPGTAHRLRAKYAKALALLKPTTEEVA